MSKDQRLTVITCNQRERVSRLVHKHDYLTEVN